MPGAATVGWARGVKMHDDEVDIDEHLVRRLMTAQFPQWAGLPIERVDSTGTVNAVFRLGDQLAIRLPRTPRWHDLDVELCWLAALAPNIPVAIPEALVRGQPAHGYPWPWAVFRWINGRTWDPNDNGASHDAADDVVCFLTAMHRLDPTDQPCAEPLAVAGLAGNDDGVRSALIDARGMLDTDAVLKAWERALRVPEWQGAPVLLPGDVLADNVWSVTAGCTP